MSANMEENPMRGTLTDEEIAARNVIPTTNPAGEPHRIIADEYFSDRTITFTQWVPTDPDQPGPAAYEQLKPTVLSEAQKHYLTALATRPRLPTPTTGDSPPS